MSLNPSFLCSLLPHPLDRPLLLPSPTDIPSLGSNSGKTFSTSVGTSAANSPLRPSSLTSLYQLFSFSALIPFLSWPFSSPFSFSLPRDNVSLCSYFFLYSRTANPLQSQQQQLFSYLLFKLLLTSQDILTIALHGPVSLSLLLPGNLLLLPHLLDPFLL